MELNYDSARVFVTGHTGFKAGWLVSMLKELGAEVGCLSIPYNGGYSGEYPQLILDKNFVETEADVTDLDAVIKSIGSFKPNIIFHLAAQPLVIDSYKDPVATFDVNIMGTVNILEAARVVDSVESVVIITSDKCYENKENPKGYSESDRLGGHDPYSASKACAEIVSASYANALLDTKDGTKSVRVGTARAGNVIGGGDWSRDRLFPDIVRGMQKKQKVLIRNPSYVRPWQHVLDPLWGYILLGNRLLNKTISSGAWNFGPNSDDLRSVSDVTKIVKERWPVELSYPSITENSFKETKVLALKADKAKKDLGWYPRISFEEGVNLTLDWFDDFINNKNVLETTKKQIDKFLIKISEE